MKLGRLRPRHAFPLLLCSTLLVAPLLAQQPAHSHTAPLLGTVDFRNSGNAAAQAPLQRGVLWLHNFKYGEAALAFREAQQADQSLAVAYWLEALTYSHVVWSEEDLLQSQKALDRLAPTPALRLAKANTTRERAFGAAVEAFFVQAPLARRTRAYSDSLQSLVASDSTDLEAAAFASHGAMIAWMAGTVAEKPKLAATSRSLALRVFKANPNHPGAAHYLTHVADMDPGSAAELLQFARAYDKIAPDADHALHMPSHVYLPLGLWSEVSSANERSWSASRAEVESNRASLADLSWHSLQWLQYAYLQEGRWDAARAKIDSANKLLAGVKIEAADPDARFAGNVLAFMYSVDAGDWSAWRSRALNAASLFEMPTPTTRAWTMTMTNAYQQAVAAVHTGGDRAFVRAVAQRFRQIADTLPQDVRRQNVTRLADHIDALIARAEGSLPRAIAILRVTAAGEPTVASTPPTYIPTHELLGEMLLQANQPGDAALAYRAALSARPNRSRALLGLARSLRAAGDRTGAEDAYRRLDLNWSRADSRVQQSIGAERGR